MNQTSVFTIRQGQTDYTGPQPFIELPTYCNFDEKTSEIYKEYIFPPQSLNTGVMPCDLGWS